MIEPRTGIVVYTTKWCPACWRAKQLMDSMQVSYTEIDIAKDSAAAETVMRMNRGYRSVPTIVFPDGSHLTEPRAHELERKLEAYR